MNVISNIWNHPKTSIAGLLIAIATIAGVLSQQGITLGNAGTGTVVTLVSALATALLGLLSRDPETSAPTTGSTAKVGVLMLCALLLMGTMPMAGCSGTTVAQDIVNWTPTIISAAQTVDASVAVIDPSSAAIIIAAGTTFTAAANLVDAQAKTYLANPNATSLQQLQAQALAFQSNVTTALLQVAHITNSMSQQKILVGLNSAVTGISAILALIQTVKGNTLTPASVTAPKLALVIRQMDVDAAIAEVAQHEGLSNRDARVAFNTGIARLQAAGF
jgi:hypothetical protein